MKEVKTYKPKDENVKKLLIYLNKLKENNNDK